jgi:hypothetical protein
VVVNGVGHSKEFLHRVHHFGRFCPKQFTVQDQNLERRREKDDLDLPSLQWQWVSVSITAGPPDCKLGILYLLKSTSSSTLNQQVSTHKAQSSVSNSLLSASSPDSCYLLPEFKLSSKPRSQISAASPFQPLDKPPVPTPLTWLQSPRLF